MSSQRKPFVSSVVDSSRAVMRVLHLHLQHFQHAVINLIQIWWIWRPQLRWDNFWSFLLQQLNGSMCEWAFHVSQGSVKTLFRWGGKRLHHFEAKLFRKRCTKFHQNRPSFIGDITKKTFWSLFLGRSVGLHLISHVSKSSRSIMVKFLLLSGVTSIYGTLSQ